MRMSKSAITGILLLSLPIAAASDPLPYGAKTPTPSQITAVYIGKTEKWDANCNGGIYFGANNEARAWCAENPDTLGAGKWYVDSYGRMCHNLTWYWPKNGGAGSSPGEESCVLHVSDRFKRVWRSYPGETEWWPVRGNASLVVGYTFQDEVRTLRGRLGL